jgi:hypothetical protein
VPDLLDAAHEGRQLQMIEAIVRYSSKNLMELVQAFDRVTGEDLGWRWYREFFYKDYRTGKTIESELVIAQDFPKSDPKSKGLCLRDPRNHEGFFTPWRERHREEIRERVKRTFAQSEPAAKVLFFAQKASESFGGKFHTARSEFGEHFELAKKAQLAAVRNVVNCEKHKTDSSFLRNGALIGRIRERFNEGRSFGTIGLGNIAEYLRAGCRGDISLVQETMDRWQKELEALDRLAARADQPASENEHYQNVFEALRIHSVLLDVKDEIEKFKRLTQVLQDWSKPRVSL